MSEQTSWIDIKTMNNLEEYWTAYSGCVIIVTNVRYFLNKTTDHLFAMEGDGEIKDFPGDYSEYREWKREQQALEAAQKEDKPRPTEQPRTSKQQTNKLTFNEKREFTQIEVELPKLEHEKEVLESRMSSGEMSSDELVEAAEQISKLIERIDEMSMRWLELSEKDS